MEEKPLTVSSDLISRPWSSWGVVVEAVRRADPRVGPVDLLHGCIDVRTVGRGMVVWHS